MFPATSNVCLGPVVPIPTFPPPSITNGVVSPDTSFTLNAKLLVPVA